MKRPFALSVSIALLLLAGAGNVLAQAVDASSAGLYLWLPQVNAHREGGSSGAAARGPRRRVLVTTLENAHILRQMQRAAARLAASMGGAQSARDVRPAVVLIETHHEGRAHVVTLRPEDHRSGVPAGDGPSRDPRRLGPVVASGPA